MIRACIDIGTNTTRLLVAQSSPGGLRELEARRAFTRIGAAQGPDGTIAADKIAEVAGVVAQQAQAARAAGAECLCAVATACIRRAPNAAALAAAVREAAGVELVVLSEADEARLSFEGAVRTLPAPPVGTVGVADVGGGSTELVVGTARGGVRWWASVAVGSSTLAQAHGRDMAALRAAARAAFSAVGAPRPQLAVAVGGSATSLRRLCGPRLDAATLDRAARLVVEGDPEAIAAQHGLVAERVRLLPAALVILSEAAAAFGAPLDVARGGLREGVILSTTEVG